MKKKNKVLFWVKVVLIGIIIILSAIIVAILVVASKVNKIEKIEIDKEVVEESITEEVEHKTGYLNVAVFGLDSRDGSLGKGNLSDTIMVASLNHETYEVKLVSVYRDTFLKMQDGSYNKANAAYSYYGPEGAVTLLNQNLDLNIDKYVSVNFNALVDVIDAVGGMDLDLTYEEVVHMNNYCVETSKVTGKSYEKIEPEAAGTYHLNGVQAVSYSRIRYTAGGDMQRTVRQRLVISKIMEKMQKLDLKMVNDIADAVFPQVATNFTLTEILSYAKDFQKYRLGDTMGFPQKRTSAKLHPMGWVEVAQTLPSNVTDIHQFLFADMEYQPSSVVEEIDDVISYRISSGYYAEPKEEPSGNTSNQESGEESGGTTEEIPEEIPEVIPEMLPEEIPEMLPEETDSE